MFRVASNPTICPHGPTGRHATRDAAMHQVREWERDMGHMGSLMLVACQVRIENDAGGVIW